VNEDACCLDEDTADAIREVFSAKPEDITWVTPVLEEHFTYHSSILAGRTRLCGHRHKVGIVIRQYSAAQNIEGICVSLHCAEACPGNSVSLVHDQHTCYCYPCCSVGTSTVAAFRGRSWGQSLMLLSLPCLLPVLTLCRCKRGVQHVVPFHSGYPGGCACLVQAGPPR